MVEASNGAANGAGPSGHSVVLVLDYGSQYTQLIARRIREIGMLSILLPGDASMVRSVCASCLGRGLGQRRAPVSVVVGQVVLCSVCRVTTRASAVLRHRRHHLPSCPPLFDSATATRPPDSRPSRVLQR